MAPGDDDNASRPAGAHVVAHESPHFPGLENA
jgi:hypothetical protein